MGLGRLYSLAEVRGAAELVLGLKSRVLPAIIVFSSSAVAVRSDTEIGYYAVRSELGVWTCSCPHFQVSGSCKHLVRGEVAARRETDRVTLAVPRVASSMFE